MSKRHERFLRATMPAADLVFNLARRLTPAQADAEDLVQETYARAWAAWIDGRRPRKAAPWLATICLNLGRDRLRRTATHAETFWQPTFDPPGQADVENEAVNRSMVEAALRRLPEEQRLAVILMDLCGFTAAEVAIVVGSPRGTVLARVHRGRKKLAQAVQEVKSRAPRS
ncbi:RNA polymerase sigma factor [Nonomuraea africana]|uniref:RNA polymerase sigma factor n=1 Tax=Nonomuraea africana TaxID=46171 RepID=A0ABR9KV70_9ACTN|nr:sigma-70 family RNA polymerase sigma factor [Nonomuraea africana]MBE1565936.1 RNA polymerase sigma-70 factor (ECF subfamily) [Nonomuraea africana]